MMVDGVFSQLDDVISTLAGIDVDTLAPSELDALVSVCNGPGNGWPVSVPTCWPATEDEDGALSTSRSIARGSIGSPQAEQGSVGVVCCPQRRCTSWTGGGRRRPSTGRPRPSAR